MEELEMNSLSFLGKLMHGLTKSITSGELGWLQKHTTMPSLSLVMPAAVELSSLWHLPSFFCPTSLPYRVKIKAMSWVNQLDR